MSKHTPGPWFYGIAYEAERGPIPFDRQSPGYSDNAGIIGADGTTVVGCDEYHVFNSPEDARLIAAAPDLLEALTDLRRRFHAACLAGGSDEWAADASCAKADAAIAKAEGRS